MKLKTRMTVSSILLAVVPLLAACLVVGYQSYESGKQALYQEVESNLVSRRNMKKGEVEGYIQRIEKQVLAEAANTMFIHAARDFGEAFHGYLLDVVPDVDGRDRLRGYYNNEFLSTYRQRNQGARLDTDNILGQIGDTGLALQVQYIADNPNPLGEKDALAFADDSSRYAGVHKTYHRPIRYFLEQFGFYDIFIVDAASGDVIYSVFKELDYGTSLESGPYRDSGLAAAYRAAKKVGAKRKAVFTNFEAYTPSYEGAAAFVATPILDGAGAGENVSAILIFQMPVDEINRVMTFDGRWEQAGMGASGEIYLVDGEKIILNNSRFFMEDKSGFLSLIDGSGFGSTVVSNIDQKDTTIGLLKVDSPGTREALNGNSGFAIFEDYRGVAVASAYAPIDVGGLHWAILSEVDESEAFVAIGELKTTIISSVVTFAVLALIVAAAAGWWLAGGITAPVVGVSERVQAIVRDNDFTLKVPERGDEEIKGLAFSVNSLVASLRETLPVFYKLSKP